MIIMFIGPSGSGKDTFFYPTLKEYNPYIIDNDGSIEKTQKEINSVLKKVLKK